MEVVQNGQMKWAEMKLVFFKHTYNAVNCMGMVEEVRMIKNTS